jgi:kynurenine formamidase
MHPDMKKFNIIDLSLEFREGMRGYGMEEGKSIKKDGWNASFLRIYSHAGTHVDAPYHFGVTRETIDRMSPEKFMARGTLIEVPEVQPGMSIGPSILRNTGKTDLNGNAVLFRTGWSKYENDPSMYRNRLPRISPELAELLVESGVSIIGVETPSVADVNNLDELTRVHEILLGGSVIIVEGLANLDRLTGKPFLFLAMPLKIRDGDGSPVRAIAIEMEEGSNLPNLFD